MSKKQVKNSVRKKPKKKKNWLATLKVASQKWLKKQKKKRLKILKAKEKRKKQLAKLNAVSWNLVLYVTFLAILFAGVSAISTCYYWYQKTVLSFKVSPIFQTDLKRRSLPGKITLEGEVQKEISILPTEIDENGLWVIPEQEAAYLTTTARPYELGNIVIYGHNRPHIFSDLKRMKVNDQIIIENEKGEQRTYQIFDSLIVEPDQIEVLAPTEEEVLTVYTCIGWFDSQRLVLRAVPVEFVASN